MGLQKHMGDWYFHNETAKFVSTLITTVMKENANQPIELLSTSNMVVTSY
jgi:hypothetical protein